MPRHTHRLPAAVMFALFALATLVLSPGGAETIICRSLAPTVKAVTIAEDYFQVTTRFQIDTPNFLVTGTAQSCVVAISARS